MQILIDWTNHNAGFLALILFVFTLILGWFSGIFRTLRHKPKFKLNISEVPTFISTFETIKEFKGSKTHRTAAVVYLTVTNIGTAPAQIISVDLGYHNYSFKYTFLWDWIHGTPAIGDFGHTIGENLRIFPFLFQKNSHSLTHGVTYLQSGQDAKGIVYFEQPESWGGFKPRIKNNKTKIRILVKDSFGNKYTKNFHINVVDLEYAKKFNSNFGTTLSLMEENPIENWEQ
jgi:hypothetical protein